MKLSMYPFIFVFLSAGVATAGIHSFDISIETAVHGTADREEVVITVMDGAVVLKMRQGENFPCIGIQLSDKKMNIGMGTAMELKRDEDSYLMKVKYDPERFLTMEEAIEAYLKELFRHFYDGEDEKYGYKVWEAFVQEGGLQKYLDTAREWIDDEFLDSPWNEIYG